MTMVKPHYVSYHKSDVFFPSFYSEPFVVAFVERFYTVDESVAAVTVCVNLTQPQIDIFENTVNVFVIDDVNSVYIPADATLASEP